MGFKVTVYWFCHFLKRRVAHLELSDSKDALDGKC